MSSFEQLKSQAEALGLIGEVGRNVIQQQALEREERGVIRREEQEERKRREEKEERKRKEEQEEREQQRKLELAKLEAEK